jgi:hypothetical protein
VTRPQPSKPDIHRILVDALRTPRAPDLYGLIDFLIAAILMPPTRKKSGRPLKRSSDEEQQLLSCFEALREHYRKMTNKRLSVREVLDKLAMEKYPASKRPKPAELNTLEKRLSLARTERRRRAKG